MGATAATSGGGVQLTSKREDALAAQPPSPRAAPVDSARKPSRWIRVTDGKATWYVKEVSRRAAWSLPADGIVVGEEREEA